MTFKLRLNARVHAVLFQLMCPRDCRKAREFRADAKEALREKRFFAASKATLQALSYNPTTRRGAQLLAQAKAGEGTSLRANLINGTEIGHIQNIERRLERLKLFSDTTTEALAVVKTLCGDAKGSIATLSRMKSRRRRAVFSSAFLDLLFRAIDDRDEIRQLIQLFDSFGIGDGTGARTKVYNRWLASELSFGVPHEGVHPLLDPEVFSRFTQTVQRGESVIASFPPKLKHLIEAGQVSPAHGAGRRNGQRVLVVSQNWNFFPMAAQALEGNGFELRYLDFKIIRQAFPNSDRELGLLKQTRSLVGKPQATTVREALKERNPLASDLIDWADVVFCEWFTDDLVWMSRYLQDDKTLIARLHSYEAFTSFPFFANLRRIDGIVFIAPQIRKIFESLIGDDISENIVMDVVPNFREVSRFFFVNRGASARKTLGMTQYASANKDPIFALDILKEIRADDPSWRLRFIGTPWAKTLSAKEARYRNHFEERLAEFGDSVSIEGFTSDMAAWYESIGFIISASHREGSHESLVEGMLMGAIPVLRNWPMMAPFGAPHSVFPSIQHFDTPVGAAEHILEAAVRFDERSQAASQYAERHVNALDPAVELPRFIRAVCEIADARKTQVES